MMIVLTASMGKSTAHATIGSHGSFKGEGTSSAWQITGTNGDLDVIYRGCIDTGHLGRHIIVEMQCARDKILPRGDYIIITKSTPFPTSC